MKLRYEQNITEQIFLPLGRKIGASLPAVGRYSNFSVEKYARFVSNDNLII